MEFKKQRRFGRKSFMKGESQSAKMPAPLNDSFYFAPAHAVPQAYQIEMAQLLFSTSYLEYCSFGNKLRLPLVELQKRQNIEPYLSHIQVMLNESKDGDTEFAGFFTAATMESFGKIKAESFYREEMRAMDAAYDRFVEKNARASDYFVSSLALDMRFRGLGLFNRMLEQIVKSAQRAKSKRIVLTVWNQSESLAIYLKKGFQKVDIFDGAIDVFFDRLHFLTFSVSPKAI